MTATVQEAPAATPAPQVFVSPKLAALAPDRLIDVIVRSALPVLVTVTFCAALVAPAMTVKFRELMLRDAEGDPGVLPDPA